MTYDNMNMLLQIRIPELTDHIKKETDYWKGKEVPTYCLYEGAINGSGFMVDLLTQKPNPELLSRVFGFFEEMANCEDFEVRNLLKVGILEYLWGEKLVEVANKYMHPQTKKLCDELHVYFRS